MALRRNRLRWFGHVERREEGDWVRRCQWVEMKDGKKAAGRPKKTWEQVVQDDLKEWGLDRGMVQDRVRWRGALKRRGVDTPSGGFAKATT